MSPEEYIASGMLELYASGAVSPAEKQEVEQMATQHPQVREALDAVLADFEKYASLYAVDPAPEMRDRILNAILPGQAEKGKVIPMAESSKTASGFWKIMAVAASVALIISIALNISFYSQKKEAEELKEMYKMDYQLAERNLGDKETELVAVRSELDFVLNPMTQAIVLNTTDTTHPMKAMIHWDTQSKMVAVDPMSLPETSASQMYVLWAVVDGVAVNKGAFTVSDSTGIVMLEIVPEAQAFAISLETRPDVPQHEGPIYVLGKTPAVQP